jgi:hypothetical protein
VNGIIGGWQASMIGTMQAGAPVSTNVQGNWSTIWGDANATGQLSVRPNIIGNPKPAGYGQPAIGQRGIQLLDPAAFARPALFSFGDAPRSLNGPRLPGIVNFDVMLAKNFIIRERIRAQFRWEAFDVSNTPFFGFLPANTGLVNTLGTASFGVLQALSGNRQMQLGLKLYW